MRSFIISIILFLSSGFCIAQEIQSIKNEDKSCDDQNYKLSLFKTNDALFSASHCITIVAPDLKLVLTERQNSQDSRFVSTPSDKEVLEKMPSSEVENVEHRMIWIKEAARKYHRLMKEQPEKIHASLKALAGWYSDKLPPKA